MSTLRNVEGAISGFFDRIFGSMFRGYVEPVELARKIAREMEDHKTVSVTRVYVPNEFVVYLSEPDYRRFASWETKLTAEIHDYLSKRARHAGFTLLSDPIVRLEADGDLRVGVYGIACRMVDVPADGSEPEPVAADDDEAFPGTSVRPPAGEMPFLPFEPSDDAPFVADPAAERDPADAAEAALPIWPDPVDAAPAADVPADPPADETPLEPSADDAPAETPPEAVTDAESDPAPDPEPEPEPVSHSPVDQAAPATPEPPPASAGPELPPAPPQTPQVDVRPPVVHEPLMPPPVDIPVAPAAAMPPLPPVPPPVRPAAGEAPAAPSPLPPPGGYEALAGVSGTQIFPSSGTPDEDIVQEEVSLIIGGRRVRLSRRTTTLGRSRDCDIPLSDPNASRQHAEIRHIGLDYFLVDQNSTNGTYVNGQRVRRHALANGDRITIGTTEMIVELIASGRG